MSVLGLAALHALGALLLTAARTPWPHALRSPSVAWAALAALHLISFGPAGVVLLGLAAVALWRVRGAAPEPPQAPWALLGGLAVLVLARPWVPTQWDEFVWLGKARLEALGFGAGARAALAPAEHLIPPGYPSLWPSAVGWLSLGRDGLAAHVVAGSLLVLLAGAAALEAWTPLLRARGKVGRLAPLAAVAAPLVWVHLRSTYVDLPVGLLGVALLGQLLRGNVALATALAVALVGLKDEGVAHVVAATLAALLATGTRRPSWPHLAPAGVALLAAATWRGLLALHQVTNVDHSLGAPYWPWLPTFARLFWLHATDIFSWGVFWAVALAVVLRGLSGREGRALRWLMAANLGFMAVGLLAGPERVRVFAENGTLVNRLLLQLWPGAALAVLFALARRGGAPEAGNGGEPQERRSPAAALQEQ